MYCLMSCLSKAFVSTKQAEKKKAAKMKMNIHQEQQTWIKGDFKDCVKPTISEETLVTDKVLFSGGVSTLISILAFLSSSSSISEGKDKI